MDIVSKFISAINAAGIPCFPEYPGAKGFEEKKREITAFAGIRKILFESLREGISDISAEVRITVQSFGSDGEKVFSAAREKIFPAAMECGEEIYSAEISGIMYDGKTDRICCEIIFKVRRSGDAV